jgi:hypothetical protein
LGSGARPQRSAAGGERPPEPTATYAHPEPAVTDLTGWRPDEAGYRLAIDNGAIDLDAEIAGFLLHHRREGTSRARLPGYWLTWCGRIGDIGPRGTRRAPVWTAEPDAAGPTIDGTTFEPVPQANLADVTIPTTAIATPEQPDDGRAWDEPATDAELANVVERIRRCWARDLCRDPDPGTFLTETRQALAPYPSAVLHRAVDHVRSELRFPPKPADFVRQADTIMTTIRSHLAFRQTDGERQAREAERRADDAAREADAGRRQTEATERRRQDLHGPVLAAGSVRQLFEAIWPPGVSLRPVRGEQCCAILRLARTNLERARGLAVACIEEWTFEGPAPDLSGLDVTGDPLAIMRTGQHV